MGAGSPASGAPAPAPAARLPRPCQRQVHTAAQAQGQQGLPTHPPMGQLLFPPLVTLWLKHLSLLALRINVILIIESLVPRYAPYTPPPPALSHTCMSKAALPFRVREEKVILAKWQASPFIQQMFIKGLLRAGC